MVHSPSQLTLKRRPTTTGPGLQSSRCTVLQCRQACSSHNQICYYSDYLSSQIRVKQIENRCTALCCSAPMLSLDFGPLTVVSGALTVLQCCSHCGGVLKCSHTCGVWCSHCAPVLSQFQTQEEGVALNNYCFVSFGYKSCSVNLGEYIEREIESLSS